MEHKPPRLWIYVESVEPGENGWFRFNTTDGAVMVKFTPEQMRAIETVVAKATERV